MDHLPSDETNPHVLRVGWSADDTSMQLGKFLQLNCFVVLSVQSLILHASYAGLLSVWR